jgi:hypothetical protein
MTTFEEGLLNSLAPWAPPGSDLQKYTSALATMFEAPFQLVADQGSPDEPATYQAGWSVLLDPENCPAQFLPYCGAFVGVVVPPGTDEATARAKILAEQNFNRGTPDAIVRAAKLWLSGTQSVYLFERTAADGSTPDPYHFVLSVLTSEVTDQAQLTVAVDAVKPAGVQWTLIQTASWTIAELELPAPTVSATEATFPDISHLETDVT